MQCWHAVFGGDAENAWVENAARSKLQGVENAWVEISGGRLFERMWYIDIVTLLL